MAEDFRRDITENMYLEDIKSRDIDNLKLVHQNLRDNYFDTQKEAMFFMGNIMNAILKKFGVDQLSLLKRYPNRHQKKFLEKLIDKELRKADLKVERRDYSGEDWWKSGVYYYHHNEIAYWMSEPIRVKGRPQRGIILPDSVTYLVRTNFTTN